MYLPGVWWRTVLLDCCDSALVARTDGFKIREIFSQDETDDSRMNRTQWAATPSQSVRVLSLYPTKHIFRPLLMAMLPYNEPNITGYSLLWNFEMRTLYAHTGERDSTIYQGQDEGVWVYFHIEIEEGLCEIWR
ncbi:hypothetical protein CMUS01_07720 [Colletotrichum musicola]|uniref:Uncharacterized protein n=1 Tax=Colletotrichum musicola TaxID=2175873 RepID=A0A8H6KGC5_9PEZI|nr:hypothetical protein CMUS01_07720 [Colletotrichum musicola]